MKNIEMRDPTGIKEPIKFSIGPEDKITEKEKLLQGVLFIISGELNSMQFGTERAYKLDRLIKEARDGNGIVDIKDLRRIYEEVATVEDIKTYIKITQFMEDNKQLHDKYNIRSIIKCLKINK